MTVIVFTVLILGAYILGSIPFGLLISRLKGVDIRREGSGNIGATNVFRSVGKGYGITTFCLDFLKGFVPAALFPLFLDNSFIQPSTTGLILGFAAIAGHNWSIFIGFKGGKGVATSTGVLIGVAPAAAGIGFVAWVLLLLLTRYVSVASMGAALTVAVSVWALYLGTTGWLLPSILTILAALVILRHKGNIQRLIRGEENRFNTLNS